jgi:hypothetical protein
LKARAWIGVLLGALLFAACGGEPALQPRGKVDARFCVALARLNELTQLQPLGAVPRTADETDEQLGIVASEFRELRELYRNLGLMTLSSSMSQIADAIGEYRTALTDSTFLNEGRAAMVLIGATRRVEIGCDDASALPITNPASGAAGFAFSGDLKLELAARAGTSSEDMASAIKVIERRLSALGATESTVTGSGQLIEVHVTAFEAGPVVENLGEYCVTASDGEALGCFGSRANAENTAMQQTVLRMVAALERTGRMEEREVLETIDPSNRRYGAALLTSIDPVSDRFSVPDSYQVVTYEDVNEDGVFTAGVDVEYRLGPVRISDADLVKAEASLPTDFGGGVTDWVVTFTLNEDGARRFALATSQLLGRQLAILVDGVVVTAPTVQAAITGPEGEISGGLNERRARELALVLNLGSLPFVVSQRSLDVQLPPVEP